MTRIAILFTCAMVICGVTLVQEKSAASAAASVNWVPPGLPAAPTDGPALCPGNYLKPEQGKAVLDAALAQFPDRDSWHAYARHVRERIQQGAGLAPWPRRTARPCGSSATAAPSPGQLYPAPSLPREGRGNRLCAAGTRKDRRRSGSLPRPARGPAEY